MAHRDRGLARKAALTCMMASLLLAGSALAEPRLHTPDMTLTPDVLEALERVERGQQTPYDSALLFKNNDRINRARLNDWISDGQYQAAQRQYAADSERYARNAVQEVTGSSENFTTQASKKGGPKVYSPGTDSDYIIKNVTNADQVTRMQQSYNRQIDADLARHGLADKPGTRWHNKLDVDFMADPKTITKEQFEEVARRNNDAYKRQTAADYEAVSRKSDGTRIEPQHVRGYTEEMQDFVGKKQGLLAEARSNPAFWKDRANQADIHRKMAQEQKYIERIESATDALRKQNGLPPIDRNPKIDPYQVRQTPEGQIVYRRGVPMDAEGYVLLDKDVRIPKEKGSIALRGSQRSPQSRFQTYAGNAYAQNSLNRALGQMAETYAELSKTNGQFRRAAAADIAAITKDLSPSEKGFVLENVRRIVADRPLPEGVEPGVGRQRVQQLANDFAGDVAREMRRNAPPVDPLVRNAIGESFEEGRQRAGQSRAAEAAGGKVDPFTRSLRDIDSRIAESIGVAEVPSEKMSLTRRQVNEVGNRYLPGVMNAVNTLITLKLAADVASDLGTIMAHFTLAAEEGQSDDVANQHYDAATDLAKGMIFTGTLGAYAAAVFEAMPTVGAAVGTFLISYEATRKALEVVGLDKSVDDLATKAFDKAFQFEEWVDDKVEEWFTGETQEEVEQNLRRDRATSYLRALREGRIGLRQGQTVDDLLGAIAGGVPATVIQQQIVDARGAAFQRPVRVGGGTRPPETPPGVPPGTRPPVGPLGQPPLGNVTATTGGPVQPFTPPKLNPDNSNCRVTTPPADPSKNFAAGALTGSGVADFSPPCPTGPAPAQPTARPAPARPAPTQQAAVQATPPAPQQGKPAERDPLERYRHELLCQDPKTRAACLAELQRQRACETNPKADPEFCKSYLCDFRRPSSPIRSEFCYGPAEQLRPPDWPGNQQRRPVVQSPDPAQPQVAAPAAPPLPAVPPRKEQASKPEERTGGKDDDKKGVETREAAGGKVGAIGKEVTAVAKTEAIGKEAAVAKTDAAVAKEVAAGAKVAAIEKSGAAATKEVAAGSTKEALIDKTGAIGKEVAAAGAKSEAIGKVAAIGKEVTAGTKAAVADKGDASAAERTAQDQGRAGAAKGKEPAPASSSQTAGAAAAAGATAAAGKTQATGARDEKTAPPVKDQAPQASQQRPPELQKAEAQRAESQKKAVAQAQALAAELEQQQVAAEARKKVEAQIQAQQAERQKAADAQKKIQPQVAAAPPAAAQGQPPPAARPACEVPFMPLKNGDNIRKPMTVSSGDRCGGTYRTGSLALVAPPRNGTLAIEGQRYIYTPKPGYKGADAFTLTNFGETDGKKWAATIGYDVNVVDRVAAADSKSPYPQVATTPMPAKPQPAPAPTKDARPPLIHPQVAATPPPSAKPQPQPAPAAVPPPAPQPICQVPTTAVNAGQHISKPMTVSRGHRCPGSFGSGAIVLSTPPRNGTVIVEGNRYAYTPRPGFVGQDAFTLTSHWPWGGKTWTGHVTYNVTVVPQ